MKCFDAQPPLADVIGLPVYIVDSIIRRDLGGGIASITNCRTINGVCIPVCEVVIAAHHLLPLSRAGSDFAAEMYKRHQMEMMLQIGACH